MVCLEDLERPPIRLGMAFLILLEVYLIVTHFLPGFQDYLFTVLIILALPTAYFAFHFLRSRFQPVKTYEAILRSPIPRDASEETRIEIEKLLASKEYQEYERKK
jgi:hypothetical protein